MKYFKNIICGAGPAGMGMIVRAATTGRLEELANSGLLLVEKQSHFGAGAIANYKAEANTAASVFLEVIDRAENLAYLDDIRCSTVYKLLNSLGDRPPPLPVVARLQRKIALAVLLRLQTYPNVLLLRNTPLESLHVCGDGTGVIAGGRQQKRWLGSNVFLNLGGIERLPSVLRTGQHPVACLWAFHQKAEFGTKLLALGDSELRRFVMRNTKLAFIGGSHTTFALLSRIHSVVPLRLFDKIEVRILTGHEPKLYLPAADPDTDPANVCPVTGRVNRFGGLRFSAAAIANQIRGDKFANKSIHVVDANTSEVWVRQVLTDSARVVFACGFVPRRPPIYRHDGSLLLHDPDSPIGTIPNSQDGQLDKDCKIFSWGIGNGPRPDHELGGEPNLRGRVEGVWVYQHVLAERMLQKALAKTKGI